MHGILTNRTPLDFFDRLRALRFPISFLLEQRAMKIKHLDGVRDKQVEKSRREKIKHLA